MNEQINKSHGNSDTKYGSIDTLDLIKYQICTENCCQQSEFGFGCPSCRLSYIRNLKHYLKNKLNDLNHQTFDCKSHFKKSCCICLRSFHVSSFEDGHFNLQKMFKVEKECNNCRSRFTAERSFYHNCSICNESFNNCELLLHHRETEHSTEKPHQCVACHQSLSARGIRFHITKHQRPHICLYCNRKYATKFGLKLHMISHTGKKPFSCIYCPKQFKSKRGLDVHLFEHTGDKKWKCDVCDKPFANQSMCNLHKIIHMEKSFKCQYCPKKYKLKSSLDVHIFVHTGGKKYKCDLCEKTFAKQFQLNQHKSTHMEKSFQCKYCPKQFKTKQNLDIHLFKHTGDKQFKCELCDKTFATRYLFNRHKPYHMENPIQMEKPFQCKYCPKKYNQKRSLVAHLFEHTGGKKFKCDLCDKTFATQFSINQHKSIHMAESFPCIYCSKEYKSKRYLDIHLFEHNGGKPFKCDSCEKTFAKQFLLNQHKVIHMDKKTQCKICSKFYKTAKSLKDHVKSIHKSLGYD